MAAVTLLAKLIITSLRNVRRYVVSRTWATTETESVRHAGSVTLPTKVQMAGLAVLAEETGHGSRLRAAAIPSTPGNGTRIMEAVPDSFRTVYLAP